MELSIIAFVLMFSLLASAGLVLFGREVAPQQITNAIIPSMERKTLSTQLQKASASLARVVERFDGVVPKSEAEASAVRQRLIHAGFRNDSAVKIFYGGKFLSIVILVMLVLVTGLASFNYLLVIFLALVVGFFAPDFWLGQRLSARKRSIRLGLPDVLDLLIVCVEAGLSLDQATSRTADELSKAQSAISDELNMVVLEQRAGCPRSDAWKHFADRADVPSVRSVVSMLVQSEQFGTSIARTLRVHSETLRIQRIQQVEEQAAKATIKMLFPLVLFIFPAIFVVTLGPAIITVMMSFSQSSNQ